MSSLPDNSLKAMVVDRIRSAIIAGDYQPGAHLTEQSVADELHISRGPVREALLQLQQEGLVKINPRRGCEITTLSPAEAADIYLLRGHLESLAVRLARQYWLDADTDFLQRIIDEMRVLREGDWQLAIDGDLLYHHRIVEASRSKPLIQMYRSMDSKVTACFMTVRQHLHKAPHQMADHHQPLVNALAERDFWRAEFLAANHWADTAAGFRALVRA